jgi:hypothetical protein
MHFFSGFRHITMNNCNYIFFLTIIVTTSLKNVKGVLTYTRGIVKKKKELTIISAEGIKIFTHSTS